MRINPVSKTNFKSIYLVVGYGSAQRNLKEECLKYSDRMTYVPISRSDLDSIKNQRCMNIVRKYTNVDEKPALIVSGCDFKKYQHKTEGYRNKEDLLEHVNGVLLLPLSSPNTMESISEEYS